MAKQQSQRPSRVIIDRVLPEIDRGRFAAKRYDDEQIKITAHILVDGHDMVKGRVLLRHSSEQTPHILQLKDQGNDKWSTEFHLKKLGRYYFTVQAAVDRFGTWRADMQKKIDAQQNVSVDLLIGERLVKSWFAFVNDSEKEFLKKFYSTLKSWSKTSFLTVGDFNAWAQTPELERIAYEQFDKASFIQYDHEVPLQVEPAQARFSTWYEFFPRSTVTGPARHGTFKDAEARLDDIKKMGFDVVYLPPIHPVGKAFRKGKNNTLNAQADDVGSPWAIGGEEGGHKSIFSQYGTMEDFHSLVKKANSMELQVAMDIAYQCSPDHPYVKEHPEWFKQRPDGSIQYAENPPKKYQDIYPFDFESTAWREMWEELRSVVDFWIAQGVRIFRVDNPHTKAFHFWEWMIAEVKENNPDVIFLSEAFTRPKIMAYLAKIGFSQSYTYFTWRNTKWELTQYMNRLTQTELADYFVPNFWPNTPDILPLSLQEQNETMFKQRLVLAATLSSNYGIYGPAFELMVSTPRQPGAEEYLNSEKYEIYQWNLNAPNITPYITKVNQIRKQEKALQSNRNFRFHPIDNEFLLAYSKSDGGDRIVVIVNLDAKNKQSGWVELPLIDWSIPEASNFVVHDLLTDIHYSWKGWRNYIELRPGAPAHIFKIKTISKVTDYDYGYVE
ncbi:MAG TPA: alpha-1,4-glucan--maltose-1-phosphate maltosyltransferase [Bdellovibrio sp.]|uniref:alpha-1,4-glucan--maltose-1-phosphate maltosyltransferase n=1 Tax=Bdellovibrio sp. TaxID=28201 RepID=UPI002F05E430